MSAAPAISPTYQSVAQPVAGPEPLSELSKRAVADFDHFVYIYLRTQKIETLRNDPAKFEKFSKKHGDERLIDWPRVQVKKREITDLDDELRNKILVEAVHLGALSPYHPDHKEAIRLHGEERQKELRPKPVIVP